MTTRMEVKVRLMRDDDVAMGPGKADLLDAIAQSGSISGAARAMHMSYRRAWMLVDVMNRSFREPLVHSVTGGHQGGGARLTDAGVHVLAQYRVMEAAAVAAARVYLDALAGQLNANLGR